MFSKNIEMSLKDMRAELRALRKESVKPISKMRKGDISGEIERLKAMRSDTPAPASIPSAPLKKSKSAVETIKEAKMTEFPVMPDSGTKKKMMAPKKAAAAPEKKKMSMKEKMEMALKMLESDSE